MSEEIHCKVYLDERHKTHPCIISYHTFLLLHRLVSKGTSTKNQKLKRDNVYYYVTYRNVFISTHKRINKDILFKDIQLHDLVSIHVRSKKYPRYPR